MSLTAAAAGAQTAISTGESIFDSVTGLFGGGGGGPDPAGTKRAGSPPYHATVYEDRTDQDGSDPAKLKVSEGRHSLATHNMAGFSRSARVDAGWVLKVLGTGGQSITIRGPSSRVNFRDKGLSGNQTAAVVLRPTDQGGSRAGGGATSPGGGSGGSSQSSQPRVAGMSNQTLILVGLGLFAIMRFSQS